MAREQGWTALHGKGLVLGGGFRQLQYARERHIPLILLHTKTLAHIVHAGNLDHVSVGPCHILW